MIRAKLVKPESFKLEKLSNPKLQENDILVKVIYSGVCGSDIHCFLGINPFATYPIILGHEFVGKIINIGSNVKNFLKEQIITAEPINSCKHCVYCKNGNYHLCINNNPALWQGSFSEYIVVKEHQSFLIPDQICLKEAIFIEPLAVAIHALKLSKIKKTNKILIIGGGTIGQLIIKLAKYYNIKYISVLDLFESKLNIALNNGADDAIKIQKYTKYIEIINIIKENNIDIVFDCVGNPFTINNSIEIIKKGGKIMLVGVPLGKGLISLDKLFIKELSLLGCLTYKSNFPESIELLNKNKIVVSDLISKIFELKKINESFKDIIKNNGEYIKCIIKS